MSKRYETEYTLDLDRGGEQDFGIRAHVQVEYERGVPLATIDGEIEVLYDGNWEPIAKWPLSDDTLSRVEDALCEFALEDDSDICAMCDAYDNRDYY